MTVSVFNILIKTCILLLCIPRLAFSQLQVVNASGEGIGYVHICDTDNRLLTISNELGYFSLPSGNDTDTLVFSHIVYQPLKLSVQDIRKITTVRLSDKDKQLDNVSVTPASPAELFEKIKRTVTAVDSTMLFSSNDVLQYDSKTVIISSEDIRIYNDSLVIDPLSSGIRQKVYDMDIVNGFGGFSFTHWNKKEQLASYMDFESYPLDWLGSYTLEYGNGDETMDSLIMFNENKERVGHIIYTIPDLQPVEIKIINETEVELPAALKLMFKARTKHRLVEIKRATFTQIYSSIDNRCIPVLSKADIELLVSRNKDEVPVNYIDYIQFKGMLDYQITVPPIEVNDVVFSFE